MSASARTQVVVLNGGSSAGKSEISRSLQGLLGHPWLRLSVDDLVDRLPPHPVAGAGSGIAFEDGGAVVVGQEFRLLEGAWLAGVAATAAAGAGVLYEDVFLDGEASQQRIRQHFDGLEVLWVGVRCRAETAAARESARGDRPPGMAASQADRVHHGVHYDLEVDTARTDAAGCARLIARSVWQHQR